MSGNAECKTGRIDLIFARFLSTTLEVSEGTVGDHIRWRFHRKTLLKRINEVRNDVIEEVKEIVREARRETERKGNQIGQSQRTDKH
jgi:hypothetical protein